MSARELSARLIACYSFLEGVARSCGTDVLVHQLIGRVVSWLIKRPFLSLRVSWIHRLRKYPCDSLSSGISTAPEGWRFRSLRAHQCDTDIMRGILGRLIRGIVLGGVVDAELNSTGPTARRTSKPGQSGCCNRVARCPLSSHGSSNKAEQTRMMMPVNTRNPCSNIDTFA